MKYRNIAIGSNDEVDTKNLIVKMVKEGYMRKHKYTVSMLLYNFYIPDLDIIVSPLSLEMHYPLYDDNKIYFDA